MIARRNELSKTPGWWCCIASTEACRAGAEAVIAELPAPDQGRLRHSREHAGPGAAEWRIASFPNPPVTAMLEAAHDAVCITYWPPTECQLEVDARMAAARLCLSPAELPAQHIASGFAEPRVSVPPQLALNGPGGGCATLQRSMRRPLWMAPPPPLQPEPRPSVSTVSRTVVLEPPRAGLPGDGLARLHSAAAERPPPTPLLCEAFDRWLQAAVDDATRSRCAEQPGAAVLLGEEGTGRTTSLLALASRCAKVHRHTPIVIHLGSMGPELLQRGKLERRLLRMMRQGAEGACPGGCGELCPCSEETRRRPIALFLSGLEQLPASTKGLNRCVAALNRVCAEVRQHTADIAVLEQTADSATVLIAARLGVSQAVQAALGGVRCTPAALLVGDIVSPASSGRVIAELVGARAAELQPEELSEWLRAPARIWPLRVRRAAELHSRLLLACSGAAPVAAALASPAQGVDEPIAAAEAALLGRQLDEAGVSAEGVTRDMPVRKRWAATWRARTEAELDKIRADSAGHVREHRRVCARRQGRQGPVRHCGTRARRAFEELVRTTLTAGLGALIQREETETRAVIVKAASEGPRGAALSLLSACECRRRWELVQRLAGAAARDDPPRYGLLQHAGLLRLCDIAGRRWAWPRLKIIVSARPAHLQRCGLTPQDIAGPTTEVWDLQPLSDRAVLKWSGRCPAHRCALQAAQRWKGRRDVTRDLWLLRNASDACRCNQHGAGDQGDLDWDPWAGISGLSQPGPADGTVEGSATVSFSANATGLANSVFHTSDCPLRAATLGPYSFCDLALRAHAVRRLGALKQYAGPERVEAILKSAVRIAAALHMRSLAAASWSDLRAWAQLRELCEPQPADVEDMAFSGRLRTSGAADMGAVRMLNALPLRRFSGCQEGDADTPLSFLSEAARDFCIARGTIELQASERMALLHHSGGAAPEAVAVFIEDKLRLGGAEAAGLLKAVASGRVLHEHGDWILEAVAEVRRVPILCDAWREILLRTARAARGREAPLRARRGATACLAVLCQAGISLRGCDLREVQLAPHAPLRGCDLREADMRGAGLWRADLRGADMREALLDGALLNGCNLCGADLTGASLRAARLYAAPMHQARLVGAALEGAMGIGTGPRAGLRRTDFSGTELERAWDVGDLSAAAGVARPEESDEGDPVPFSALHKDMAVRLTPPVSGASRRACIVVSHTSESCLVRWILQQGGTRKVLRGHAQECYVSRAWWNSGADPRLLVKPPQAASRRRRSSVSTAPINETPAPACIDPLGSSAAQSPLFFSEELSSRRLRSLWDATAGPRLPRPPLPQQRPAAPRRQVRSARKSSIFGLRYSVGGRPSSAPQRQQVWLAAATPHAPPSLATAKRHFGERWEVLSDEEKRGILQGETPTFARNHLTGCCADCGDFI